MISQTWFFALTIPLIALYQYRTNTPSPQPFKYYLIQSFLFSPFINLFFLLVGPSYILTGILTRYHGREAPAEETYGSDQVGDQYKQRYAQEGYAQNLIPILPKKNGIPHQQNEQDKEREQPGTGKDKRTPPVGDDAVRSNYRRQADKKDNRGHCHPAGESKPLLGDNKFIAAPGQILDEAQVGEAGKDQGIGKQPVF